MLFSHSLIESCIHNASDKSVTIGMKSMQWLLLPILVHPRLMNKGNLHVIVAYRLILKTLSFYNEEAHIKVSSHNHH